MASETAPSEIVFLIQILLLVFVGRALGEAMQRIGQPAVMGPLLGGLVLGPSVLGALWPEIQQMLFPPEPAQKAMLGGVADLGVLMLLLLAGTETDLRLVRRTGRAAFTVSVAGICVPFACGFALGRLMPASLLPDPDARLVASLMLGTALSISSVKIVAMVVREMGFMRRNVGQVILAAAVIDDTIGWIIIAITLSIVAHGALDPATLAESVLGTAAFLAASFTIGRRVVFYLIRWANDHLVSEAAVLSVIIVVMGVMALITHEIGVHTVLGAFVAGILVGESPIMTRQIDLALRALITGLFMPVFFGVAGLSADLTVLGDPQLLLYTGALISIATFGKFAGAFVGGELGGLRARESLALAAGMNARGSTEVIVATIGLSMGVLSQNLFTMIVAMAILTTMAMPPTLRWALKRLPLREAERERLAREEFEAKGFLPNVERVLLAVDDSPNGQFASRLTGIVAGGRGVPITLIRAGEERRAHAATEDAPSAEVAVQAGAETTREAAPPEDAKAGKVNVITRARAGLPEEAIAREALKGYDLLVLGLAQMVGPDNAGFHDDVNRIASGFTGPLMLTVARGHHLERPMESAFKILAPVTGTGASRRALEVAIAIARAGQMPVTALYVQGARAGADSPIAGRQEDIILKDAVALAEGYGTLLRTVSRRGAAPDKAILREAHERHFDLIVMGVNRRPGDKLYFGTVAHAVLREAKASILLVSS